MAGKRKSDIIPEQALILPMKAQKAEGEWFKPVDIHPAEGDKTRWQGHPHDCRLSGLILVGLNTGASTGHPVGATT